MNEQLAHINELQPIAKRMRERQEQICRDKRDVFAKIGNLVALAQEQGLDCLMAKTKLGKQIKWSDWLRAHVPTLGEDEAQKYERISTEQLSDPRQCVFAFLPPAVKEPGITRIAPSEHEVVWGKIHKLTSTLSTTRFEDWPQQQIELTKSELEPIAKRLWPERFN